MNRICRLDGCDRAARPGRHVCNRCRKRAWRQQKPQWEVDLADVEAIVSDPRPTDGLTRPERLLIAQGLTARAVPAGEIARIVGVTERSVYRWRSEGFGRAA